MDEAETRALHAKWVREREEVAAEAARLRGVAEGLSQMIAGAETLLPELAATPASVTPTTVPATAVPSVKELARAISDNMARLPVTESMRNAVKAAQELTRDGTFATPRSILSRMEEEGTAPNGDHPESVLRGTLRRLAEMEVLEKTALDGRSTGYRVPQNAESPAVTGPSVGTATTEGAGGETSSAYPSHHGDRASDVQVRDGDRDSGAPVAGSFS